ncbi:adhesion G protein-coupled receptor A3 [Neosynchiropus ocellatus]
MNLPHTVLLLLLLLSTGSGVLSLDCKITDERSKIPGRSHSADIKVVCSNMDLHQLLPLEFFPNRTVTLILTNNKIQELKNGSFYGLLQLEKLDLKSNLISRIEPGSFLGLPSLKRLDLSNNSIGCLNTDIFQGLRNLIRLNLSGNMFSSLSQGTFESLLSLKSLEFQTPTLLCDCHLVWLLQWIKDRGIAVKNTKCSYPQSLHGKLIPSLRLELLTCDTPLELPSIQLTPSQRQVVFKGDSLPFQCQASFIAKDMQVSWFQNGRVVKNDASQGIIIEKQMVQNCSLIASGLTLSNIQPGFAGNWECQVQTSRGNTTKMVHIMVLESSARYCAPERVSNNKGDFRWPRTLAGIRAYLPCNRLQIGAGAYSDNAAAADEQRAWRYCSHEGLWTDDNYANCQFQKDVTRFLYVINQMLLNESNVVPRARRLLVYTIDAANFSDKMDIIFVAEMIEKFTKFVDKIKDLSEVVVSIASNLMLADDRVLWIAQREAMACSRIRACLQKITVGRLTTAQAFSLSSPNIALEAHAVRANEWNGMACMLFQRPSPERTPGQDRQLTFKCNTTTTFSNILYKSTIVEASLQLPRTLFSQHPLPVQADYSVYKLFLLGFRNGKLFPSTGNSSHLADGGKRWSVATPIIMAKIDGMSLQVLHSPVNITLRRFARGPDALPACWNFSLSKGQGGWKSDCCSILAHHENFTTISCNSLSSYGLLMDLSGVEYTSASNQPLHPFIYATSIILLLCLLTIIISYIYHHRTVLVSRKCWHMLVNLCLHMVLTCGVFVGGINQTHNTSVCQAVGIVLHYSTLATVLWVGVTARNIYKQVTRKCKSYEELEEPLPPPRPMLRFYLIGDGIPIIVCGITAAANIKNYGSRAQAPYCWMAWEPSIGAFYGPMSFIVFVNAIYFLSTLLQLRRHPERQYELKEMTEEQQHLALANCEGVPEGPLSHFRTLNPHFNSRTPASPLSAPPLALENEHTFAAQLMGAAGALGLYAALWLFGAMSISQDNPLNLAFTCLFGVAALALAAFMMAHHCVNRQDMRRHWSQAFCSGRYSAQEEVLFPQSGVALAFTPASNNNTAAESTKFGHSSADSSHTNKSALSMRNSAHGCKLTNLQTEAAQCKSASPPVLINGASVLDNSMTEHSMDNEIKMHVSPVEVQFRPINNINSTTTMPNSSRHHKNRARAQRASRLTVLREYAYDVPTSLEGSVQSMPQRRNHHYDIAARNCRRAAYMAYREQHQSQLLQDSSDSASLPRRPRAEAKADCGGVNGAVVTQETLLPAVESSSGIRVNDSGNLNPSNPELQTLQKSYGLNLVSQNRSAVKKSVPAAPLECSGAVKSGLWKHETTV